MLCKSLRDSRKSRKRRIEIGSPICDDVVNLYPPWDSVYSVRRAVTILSRDVTGSADIGGRYRANETSRWKSACRKIRRIKELDRPFIMSIQAVLPPSG